MMIHDTWTMWVTGEQFGYQIPYFHEWRSDDTVELLDRVPIIKVTPELYDYIENDIDTLPTQLLEDVRDKAMLRKNHSATPIKHCFIATDGKKAIIVDTLTYEVPMRKSRLIPRQEALVLEMIFDTQPSTYDFDLSGDKEETDELLNPHPLSVVGLTRRERHLKDIFNKAIEEIHYKNDLEELRYWTIEMFPKDYKQIIHMSYDDLWDKVVSYIKVGWKPEFENILKMISNTNSLIKSLYESETKREYKVG